MANTTTLVTPPASLRSRLQTGIAWNLVGTVFNQGSTLVVNIIVANILGRSIFGEYSMIQSTLLTLSAIAQLATGFTATKYVAEFRSTDKEKTGRILGLCSAVSTATACIATLALLAGAPWLASYTLKAPQLAPVDLVSEVHAFETGRINTGPLNLHKKWPPVLAKLLFLLFNGLGLLQPFDIPSLSPMLPLKLVRAR